MPFGRHRSMLQRWLDVPGDVLRGVADGELLEQEPEFPVVGLCEPGLRLLREVPDLLLGRTERLLPRLVEELFVRVRRLALVLRVLAEPVVDLVAQLCRQCVV